MEEKKKKEDTTTRIWKGDLERLGDRFIPAIAQRKGKKINSNQEAINIIFDYFELTALPGIYK